MNDFSIHPETRLGPVHLTVSDLERALGFYGGVLGLRVLGHREGKASLSADDVTPVLVLAELPGACPRPPRTTGLYHVALLLPSRKDLARTFRRLSGGPGVGGPAATAASSSSDPRPPAPGPHLRGASDHLVSEALYLADPDGLGLEIYADRPREAWPRRDGKIQMATEPLDVEGLMAELEGDDRPWDGLPPGTRVGHIHLQVADLRRAEAFYHQVLGFDLVQRYGPDALFLSAGGYHHHIGLNTWASAGAPPPPHDAVGLRFFTLCPPDASELSRVVEHARGSGVAFEQRPEGVLLRDPSGNGVLLAECGII